MWSYQVVLGDPPNLQQGNHSAAVELHPIVGKRSSIHIDVWIAGWSKPGQFVHVG